MRRGLQATAALALASALAGCSGADSSDPSPPTAQAAEAPPSPSPTTDTPSPAPVATTEIASPPPVSPGEDISITCRQTETAETQAADLGSYDSFEAAWEGFEEQADIRCSASYGSSFATYTLTDDEVEAVETAGYEDEDSLRTLYGICATPLLGDNGTRFGGKPWSEGQQQEAQGALVLCPDHPDRDEIEDRMAAANAEEEARERGELFGAGAYRVGEDIQPGVYVTESDAGFDGCYWERLDSAGNIVENSFMHSGFRAEVYIAETDHSFHSSRCGTWEKQ